MCRSSAGQWNLWQTLPLILIKYYCGCGIVPAVAAAPFPDYNPPGPVTAPKSTSSSTANTMNSSGFQPAIYIPAILVIVFVAFAATFAVLRQRLRAAHLSQVYANTTPTRELTADQLTTARTNSNGNGTTAATTRGTTAPANTTSPRRSRRRRRRPSQVSVTSLPLYMEEAGDQELVLVRSEPEMQDPLPEGDETHRNDLESGLNTGSSGATTTTTPSSASQRPRTSFDSAAPDESESESETHPTTPLMSPTRIPSDETPSYEEALRTHLPTTTTPATATSPPREIDLSETPPDSPTSLHHSRDATITPRHVQERAVTASTSSPSPTSTSPTSTATTTRRMPMPNLRSFFTRGSNGSSSTSTSTRAPERALSISRTHLLTHSRSASTFSSHSLARTLSRNSQNNPNASMISLNSISAPLQHTLTRTDIAYPKGGPTAEQMRFLGSRESLGLFGVPWGEAAVRYASAEPPAFVEGAVPASAPATSGGEGEGGEVIVESPQQQERPESSDTEATSFVTAPDATTTSGETPRIEEPAPTVIVREPSPAPQDIRPETPIVTPPTPSDVKESLS